MGICTHFSHKKFAYGDPHMQKCLKKHISAGLFLHNEDVRICSYVRVLGKKYKSYTLWIQSGYISYP